MIIFWRSWIFPFTSIINLCWANPLIVKCIVYVLWFIVPYTREKTSLFTAAMHKIYQPNGTEIYWKTPGSQSSLAVFQANYCTHNSTYYLYNRGIFANENWAIFYLSYTFILVYGPKHILTYELLVARIVQSHSNNP